MQAGSGLTGGEFQRGRDGIARQARMSTGQTLNGPPRRQFLHDVLDSVRVPAITGFPIITRGSEAISPSMPRSASRVSEGKS